jgi:hypothetical protein
VRGNKSRRVEINQPNSLFVFHTLFFSQKQMTFYYSSGSTPRIFNLDRWGVVHRTVGSSGRG